MQQLLRDRGDSARYGPAPPALPLRSSLLVKVASLKANRHILRVEFSLCEAVEGPASMLRESRRYNKETESTSTLVLYSQTGTRLSSVETGGKWLQR